MKLNTKNEIGSIGRIILFTIAVNIVIMYGGALSVLLCDDGLSIQQIWERYTITEMLLPFVAACWLGAPTGIFFSAIIIAFDVDI